MNNRSNGKFGFILVVVILLAAFGCHADDGINVTNAFGDGENVAIIANAGSVKAWRTLGSMEMEQWKPGQKVDFKIADFYLKSGKPVLVSTNLAARLSELLLDKGSYPVPSLWEKNCGPLPPVVVTFSEGDKSVDVFFCFECKILIVDQIQSDFDPGCAAILKVIKKIFPHDRKIQSIER